MVADTVPDLTLIFDLDPAVGLARAHERSGTGGEDRFERKGTAFHDRLRKAFLTIAQAEPGRCAVVDAARGIEEVADDTRRIVEERLMATAKETAPNG